MGQDVRYVNHSDCCGYIPTLLLFCSRLLSFELGYSGDLVYVKSFGHGVLYINSYDAAVEILRKRSLIYSSRPPMVMCNKV